MAPPTTVCDQIVHLLDMQQPSPDTIDRQLMCKLPALSNRNPTAIGLFRKRRSVQKTAVRATCTSSVDIHEDAIPGRDGQVN